MKPLAWVPLAMCMISQASPVPDPLPVPASADLALLPRQSVSRAVSLSSVMLIHDSETFGDDEFTRVRTLDTVNLGTSEGLIKQVRYAETAGGEICIQVDLTLTLNPADLSVNVGYFLSLYEGTSEECGGDLDGTFQSDDSVGRDTSKTITATVNNNDEGGDWARLTLTVLNAP
ncbi:hypothetical protein B0H67DRAFT_483258 [Lasiosphaeris hirsuta]|uniref:Uncharacterized protein n=1 Tax=Lasiosphaeris hirsuta TaxID=260670 RepID=A0AA40ASE4_9PEZI|nr:hypothetical protein B0H67DRAFT_483258 [Lasiosphaeris hirsuta]